MSKVTVTGYIAVNRKGVPTTIREVEDGTTYKQPSLELACFDFCMTIRHANNGFQEGMSYRKATLTFNK